MAPSIVQILIIVLIVMVLFGAGRIPHIMENLAKGVNSFKKGLKDEDVAQSLEDKTQDIDIVSESKNKDKSKDV
tara:strand:+ start:677 stop:898 length:222 start_codon:yes stop_codon:yes gene_type:complete